MVFLLPVTVVVVYGRWNRVVLFAISTKLNSNHPPFFLESSAPPPAIIVVSGRPPLPVPVEEDVQRDVMSPDQLVAVLGIIVRITTVA